MPPLVNGDQIDHQWPFMLVSRAADLFSHPKCSQAEACTLNEALSQVRWLQKSTSEHDLDGLTETILMLERQ